MSNEADTCRKYVLPKLYVAGWNDDQINEQRTFTDGRIMVSEQGLAQATKRADYLLRYRPDLVIEWLKLRLRTKLLVMGYKKPWITPRYST